MVVRLLKVKRQRDCARRCWELRKDLKRWSGVNWWQQLSPSLVRMGGCQQQK